MQSVRVQAGQGLQGLPGVQPVGLAQAGTPGHQVVQLEADAVERRLPPGVGRHDEGQRLGQMRGDVHDRGALGQRLAHQRHVALRQIAHTSVQQLGRARGGTAGEIVRLEEHHRKAPQRGVQRHAQAGGATADHRQIEPGLAGQGQKTFCGVHGSWVWPHAPARVRAEVSHQTGQQRPINAPCRPSRRPAASGS